MGGLEEQVLLAGVYEGESPERSRREIPCDRLLLPDQLALEVTYKSPPMGPAEARERLTELRAVLESRDSIDGEDVKIVGDYMNGPPGAGGGFDVDVGEFSIAANYSPTSVDSALNVTFISPCY